MSGNNIIEILEIVWLMVVTGYLLNTLRRVKKLKDDHGPAKPI